MVHSWTTATFLTIGVIPWGRGLEKQPPRQVPAARPAAVRRDRARGVQRGQRTESAPVRIRRPRPRRQSIPQASARLPRRHRHGRRPHRHARVGAASRPGGAPPFPGTDSLHRRGRIVDRAGRIVAGKVNRIRDVARSARRHQARRDRLDGHQPAVRAPVLRVAVTGRRPVHLPAPVAPAAASSLVAAFQRRLQDEGCPRRLLHRRPGDQAACAWGRFAGDLRRRGGHRPGRGAATSP